MGHHSQTITWGLLRTRGKILAIHPKIFWNTGTDFDCLEFTYKQVHVMVLYMCVIYRN
jgi:hypothetical protein